jgi:hypothetical protein
MGAGPGGCGCVVTGRCAMACGRELAPNGCDCFGCCRQETSAGVEVYVQFITGCSTSDIDDELKCPRCEPRRECMNDCGDCELCGKRKRNQLPMSCPSGSSPTTRSNTCDEGQVVCGEDLSCPLDYYCQLGCCRPIIVE